VGPRPVQDALDTRKVSSYKKNQQDAQISQIYFWNRTLHVLDIFSVHHQECSTVHKAVDICNTGYADCLLAGSGCSILIPLASDNLYDIYLLLCIRYLTPDDGQETCPKHVEFYSKNKFEKLVHLCGFILRTVNNICRRQCARGCQNTTTTTTTTPYRAGQLSFLRLSSHLLLNRNTCMHLLKLVHLGSFIVRIYSVHGPPNVKIREKYLASSGESSHLLVYSLYQRLFPGNS
jgi:hypothetical protein